ncbi:MAG: sugar transferase [Candidatus Omnitrophota bacterium]
MKTHFATGTKNANLPKVSVIVPMYNEQQYIRKCLESLIAQDYDKCDIIVVDGGSTDNSVDIVQGLTNNHKVMLLYNKARIASAGLNIGIIHSDADIIIIFGAHSWALPNFITLNVALLDQVKADCVGGKIEANGKTYITKAVSLATGCYFGLGSPKFRCQGKEGYADTVAFGAYRREVFDKIGFFDETLSRGMDAEFNYRLRHRGGKIFFNPSIKIYYYIKTNLASLWIQNFRNGYWKVEIAKRHPKSMQYRQFIPFLFVLSAIIAAVAVSFGLKLPLFVIVGAYSILMFYFTAKVAMANGLEYFIILPIVFLIIHVSYGLGFFAGLRRLLINRANVLVDNNKISYDAMIKRLFDIIFSAAALISSALPLLVCALLVKITSKGSVFYRAKRFGLNGREFSMYKIRSMFEKAIDTDLPFAYQGDKRVTDIGKFLRRFKIDEIPNFINVLKGDMSVVGPRPLSLKWLKNEQFAKKHLLDIKPGVTGLSQLVFANEIIKLNGNNREDDYNRLLVHKMRLNAIYKQKQSFKLDLWIILKTVQIIIRNKI